jgi:hypothetical protein
MGHFSQGKSLALPNQVLKYGFLTISGTTGGVRVLAPTPPSSTASAAKARVTNRIFERSCGSQNLSKKWWSKQRVECLEAEGFISRRI